MLVAAPAGFGKTTLLVQSLASDQGRCVAWLSLDATDADAGQFLAHLLAAVEKAIPLAGTGARTMLEHPETPAEDVIAALLEDLEGAGPTTLVLDDYHAVDSPAVHEVVTFLIDNVPPHVTVAMTTRVDPPFPLARWRARGELLEIRAADLQFTPEEAAVFLNDVMGLGLGASAVEALEGRTEGWAAGLQLAALTARGKRDHEVARFVEAFAGSSRFVLDYLLEEVLRDLDEDSRAFLLDTSILGELSGPLCDAVTGRDDGQAMLARLERENLFLIGLDDERRWFRFHQLFADALLAQLGAVRPERVAPLHEAAARWYEAEGLPIEAVPHALAAGSHDHAAALFQRALPHLKKTRQDHRVREWLGALPESAVRGHALLAAYMAWARMAEGDIPGATGWVHAAESALATSGPAVADADSDADSDADLAEELRELPATLESYRAVIAQATGDVGGTAEHARRALELTPADNHYARGAAGGMLAAAEWASGDIDAAILDFAVAIDDLRAGGSVTNALGSVTVLATMQLARGRIEAARRLYEEALAEAERTPAGASILGDLHVGLAQMLLEQGDAAGAEAHLATAADLGDSASLPENRCRALAVRADLARVQGRVDEALELLALASDAYLPGFLPDVEPVGSVRARLLVEEGRLAEAAAWAERSGASEALTRLVAQAAVPAYLEEHAALTATRIAIARDGLTEALAHWLRLVVDALEQTSRRRGLADALSLLGSTSLRVREGRSEEVAAPGGHASVAGPLVDPLSDRERDVLRLLASDLSGPDIARELYISINTFRTHTKAVFAKLGVTSRRAAVTRARELSLL